MWAIFAAPRILGFDLGRIGLTGRGPDSPAIGLDTPGLWWFRHSGFRSGFSGIGSLYTPSRCATLSFVLTGQWTGLTGGWLGQVALV